MYCMLLHVMNNFLAISRQWNKKKSKHQLYILLYTYHSELEYTLVVMTSNVISNVIDYIYKVIVM